jgi:hypothetical protein
MIKNSTVARIALVRVVFTSEFIPPLFSGAETHEPSLRLAAQLAKHTDDDALIEALVMAALPEDYSGDSIAELPGMIAGARRKGVRQNGAEVRRVRDDRVGARLFQADWQERHRH